MTARLAIASLLFASLPAAAQPVISDVVNFASGEHTYAPGLVVSITGAKLRPQVGALSLTLSGTNCYVIAASDTQITAQLPVDAALGSATLDLGYQKVNTSFPLNIQQFAPALLYENNPYGTGSSYFFRNGVAIANTSPALSGDTLTGFAIGLGPSNPAVPTGVTPSSPTSNSYYGPTINVGGISYQSIATLLPQTAGVYFFYVNLPQGFPVGPTKVSVTMAPGFTSPPVDLQVGYGTTTTLTAPSSAPYGSLVNLSATLSPSTATGHVAFYDNGNIIGTIPVSGGQASMQTSLLSPGAHGLRAYYMGDGNDTATFSLFSSLVITASVSNSFYDEITLPTGKVPRAVAVADFNLDGKADLATANWGDDSVSVILGNGDRTFQPAKTFSVGHAPVAIVAADFNGDGIPDLAVANSNSFSIQIFFGKGDGTFLSPATLIPALQPTALAVLDLNRDGFADLLVTFEGSNHFLVYRGTGNTATPFTLALSFNGADSQQSAALADLNGDGIADLALGLQSDGLGVYLGDFFSNLDLIGTFPIGESVIYPVIADFDGDGYPDVAAIAGSGDGIAVMLNNHDGTLRPGSSIDLRPLGGGYGLSVLDFNGDGVLDLAVLNSIGVTIFTGNGDGTFTSEQTIEEQGYSSGLFAAADLNGDGRADILLEHFDGVGVLFGANGTSAQTITFPPIANVAPGAQPFTVNVSASSSLDVLLTSNSPQVCTVSLLTVTILQAGVCSLTATQPGSYVFAAAAPVTQTFSVAQSQTITFVGLNNVALGTAPFTISGAVASSGLAVTLTSTTTAVCTMSGSVVTLVAVGQCTIQASQPGNATYAPAIPVSLSFQVLGNMIAINLSTVPGGLSIMVDGTTYTAPQSLNLSPGSHIIAVNTTQAGAAGTQYLFTNWSDSGAASHSITVGSSSASFTANFKTQYQLTVSAFPIGAGIVTPASGSFYDSGAVVNLSATANNGYSFTGWSGSVADPTKTSTTVSMSGPMTVGAIFAAPGTLTAGSASAAPGATFSIPVVLTLAAGINVDALTFAIQITPIGGAPALTGALSFTKDAAITDSPFTATGGTSNSISVFWASLSSVLSATRTVGVVSGAMPAGASVGQTYTVAVTGVSGANGGGVNGVTLSPGPNASLTVRLVSYLVGDVSPYTSDTAPAFGDASLNILDVIQVLFAANGVPGFRPAACSDRFDAMDLYPVDTPTARGGDGVLDIRDVIRELFRANNLDTDRPVRSSRGGACTGGVSSQSRTATAIVPGAPRAAGALVFGAATTSPDGIERIPVYLEARRELSHLGLTFAVGDAQSQLRFLPADAPPSLAQDTVPGVLAVAWLEGIAARAGGRSLLGYLTGAPGLSERLRVYGWSAITLDDSQPVTLEWTENR